ncbi:MAG: CoA transferase, partial [Cupriavidus sp.]|nr:CoA transferase [Cupriavidus sp.]
LHPHTPNWFASDKEPQRSGNAHPNITPYDKFRTGSVDIFLAVGNNGQFANLCSVIDAPALAAHPHFESNSARSAHRGELRAELEQRFAAWDGEQLADTLIRAGVPCAPVLGLGAALDHPHTAHRQMRVELEGYRGIASPIKLSRTPATYRTTPPALNQHGREIFGDGNSEDQRARDTSAV